MRNTKSPPTIAAAMLLSLALGACSGSGPDLSPVFSYAGYDAAATSPYERGKEQLAAGRYGLAIESFRRSVAESPGSVQALNALAAAYDGIGRFDLAQRYYRRALTADPRSAQTLNNLGYSYLMQGKRDLAVAFLADARRSAQVDTPDTEVIAANLELAQSSPDTDSGRTASGTSPATPADRDAQVEGMQTRSSADPLKEEAWQEPRIVRKSRSLHKLSVTPRVQDQPKSMTDANPALQRPVGAEFLNLSYKSDPSVAQVRPDIEQVALHRLPAKTHPAFVQRRSRHPINTGKTHAEPVFAGRASVWVSNGAGRRRMAARIASYLQAEGIAVARLSNADHFRHSRSVITYRDGFLDLAESLAARLPESITLRRDDTLEADVLLRLGGDLLTFDRQLYYAEKESIS